MRNFATSGIVTGIHLLVHLRQLTDFIRQPSDEVLKVVAFESCGNRLGK